MEKKNDTFTERFFGSDNKWVLIVLVVVFLISFLMWATDEYGDSGAEVIAALGVGVLILDAGIIYYQTKKGGQ